MSRISDVMIQTKKSSPGGSWVLDLSCNATLPSPRGTHFSITCIGLQIFLEKNQFPSSLVNKTVKEYLQFDLPLIGPFSTTAQHRFKRLTQRYYIEVIVLRERLKMKV